MDIGSKLRGLRKKRGITLEELAQKSKVAVGTLSKIECGKLSGTYKTHLKIAEALGMPIVELYTGVSSREQEVISVQTDSNEIESFRYDEKASSIILVKHPSKRNMMPALLVIKPKGKTHIEENPKGAEKFIFGLEGRIEVSIGKNRYPLTKGTSLYLDSSVAHFLINTGEKTAKCLVVTSPSAL